MSELTLNEQTKLNQLLLEGIRVGRMEILPKTEDFSFIGKTNTKSFKMPTHLKGTETKKGFTNSKPRITKVMWIMDLTNGTRVLFYPNPSTLKVLHNNRLQSESKLLVPNSQVPSNVETLYRLDATYLLEDEKEVYYDSEIRMYE